LALNATLKSNKEHERAHHRSLELVGEWHLAWLSFGVLSPKQISSNANMPSGMTAMKPGVYVCLGWVAELYGLEGSCTWDSTVEQLQIVGWLHGFWKRSGGLAG
jgi:hypothetical protein